MDKSLQLWLYVYVITYPHLNSNGALVLSLYLDK